MLNARRLILSANPTVRAAMIKAALGEYLTDAALLASVREAVPPAVLKPFDELLSALREW
jgi:hypothetical protein